MKKMEKTYGTALRGLFSAVNPIKKKLMKPHCLVHRYICVHAINILKNNAYEKEYKYFKENIKSINEGATWADQDFKSSNHFYNLNKKKGLYGFSDALTECKKYYEKASSCLETGDTNEACFYLGAACHLVQDTTVPQHVNNKLLKKHRKFELWIISKLMSDFDFQEELDLRKFATLDEYIKNNAVVANDTYHKYKSIINTEERYEKISVKILKEAQATTAGVLLNFYEDNKKNIEK